MNKKYDAYIELIVTVIMTLPLSISFLLALFGVLTAFQALLLSLFLIAVMGIIAFIIREPLVALLAILFAAI
ncbi:Uncharacterised protein [Pasteurella multocida]|uniref:Uncharacterized protein n=1 Tax=Pasteurella multocida TaxID=747 RepID=A0A328UTE5_PASMD|nr:hypothetical protein [Pasteurella multocida]AFI46411.1 hypothetical protein NT08PM_1293 [Pasteurella multocida subsp. multocida str. 3480]AHE63834.1 hypothetical protein PMCN03_0368 [Pasteurella multocida subsp. multocida str. HB03]AIN49504.1 putative membrane protein [Pasteurella multocida]AWW87163.1 hypothetical protein [Pasteurella multocida]AWW87211.1 hypothetical protein [Pasteurella multocida]